MPIRIFAFILLLILTLPLSAIAMGTTDNPEAELQALIASAEKEVASTPAWQKVDKAQRQRLSEEAVRRKIITTVQSGFDKMQWQVDRKIDELLDKSLSKVLDPDAIKLGPQYPILFKEELYKYMYLKEETDIEGTYEAGKGREGNLNLLFSEGLRNNGAFEKELEDIVKNVNRRLGNVMDDQLLSEVVTCLFIEFNKL